MEAAMRWAAVPFSPPRALGPPLITERHSKVPQIRSLRPKEEIAAMRFALWALAILGAVAAASSPRRPTEFAPEFKTQRDYTYEFNAQLASGLTGSEQNAVQRIGAQLSVQSGDDDRTVVCQLKKWKIATRNDDFPLEAGQFAQWSLFKAADIPQRNVQLLEKPFEVSYEKGKVVALSFDSDDQTWSENLKRSAINALQLQLESDEAVAYFHTNETTIEGDCESAYTVVGKSECGALQRRLQRGESVAATAAAAECVQIAKSVNFERCAQRPDLRYNFFRSEAPGSDADSMGQKSLDRATVGQFEVRREENGKFVVAYGRVLSQYGMQQPEADIGFQTVAIAELKLKSVRKAQKPIEIAKKKEAESLAHSTGFDALLEAFVRDGDEAWIQQQPYLAERAIPEVVANTLRRLQQSFVAQPASERQLDTDAAHHLVNLVKVLRHATADDLKQILAAQWDNQDPQKEEEDSAKQWRREMLVDALALAGTKPAASALFKQIHSGAVQPQNAAMALRKMAKTATVVGDAMLAEMWESCKKMAGWDAAYRRSCVLSWSRLMNVACGRRVWEEHGIRMGDQLESSKDESTGCTPAYMKQQMSKIDSLYSEAGSDAELKILALKAYGNAGLNVSIPALEKIITDRSLSRIERIAAIDALRHIAAVEPREVGRLLLPMVGEREEQPEVRMNAIYQLLRSAPEPAQIRMIGAEMQRETNVNVRAFAVSALRNVAKSIEKSYPEIAQEMRSAAQRCRLESADANEQMRRANARFSAIRFDGSPLFGESVINMAALFSNDSHLPKELSAQLDAMADGHFLPAFAQIGAHQQNVEKLIEKLFNSVGQKSMGEIFVRGKRSTLGSLYDSPVQTLKNMFEQLKVVTRGQSTEQPQLLAYRRERGMDVAFALVDEKHLPAAIGDLFANGQVDLSALETPQRAIRSVDADFIAEQKVKVPTVVGMPLVYSKRLAKVGAMYGEVKFELESGAAPRSIKSARMELKTLPKVSFRMTHKLESFSPLGNSGVQTTHDVNAQLPLKLVVTYDEQSGLVAEVEIPQPSDGAYRLAQVSSHPSTITRQWPEKSRAYIEHDERTLFHSALQTGYFKFDSEHKCPLSGMHLAVRGHYHHSDKGMDAWLYGENALELNAHIPADSARRLRLQLGSVSRRVDSENVDKSSLLKAFEMQSEQLFAGVPAEERSLVREYLQRHQSQAQSLAETTIRVEALDAAGKQPQKAVSVTVKSLCDNELVVCMSDVDIHTETKDRGQKPWNARMMAHVARPQLSGVYESMRSQHIVAHAEMQWGSAEKNTLTVCAYGRPSGLQVEHYRQLLNVRSAQRNSRLEQFDGMSDDEYDRMVLKQMPSRLSANHMTMVFEHQLSDAAQQSVQPFVQYVKYGYQPLKSLFAPFDASADEKMNAHALLKAELTVENRQLKFKLNDVTRQQRLPEWHSIGESADRSNEFLGIFSADDDSKIESAEAAKWVGQRPEFGIGSLIRARDTHTAHCSVDHRFNIESFDGKHYRIPVTSCWTLLSADCGSLSPKFGVLAKRDVHHTEFLRLKLIVPTKTFELFLNNQQEMQITADGVLLQESEYARYGIHKVGETRFPTYSLQCSVTGMEVRFDGRLVFVQITEEYLNKQCGVCGHYNGDAADTLRNPDNSPAKSLVEFQRNWKDPECQQEEPKEKNSHNGWESESEEEAEPKKSQKPKKKGSKLRHDTRGRMSDAPADQERRRSGKSRKSDWEQSEESKVEIVSPKQRTIVMEEGMDKICFSIRPHAECPRGFTPVFSHSADANDDSDEGIQAEFACERRSSKNARKWQREIKQSGVVEDLETRQSNQRFPVNEPVECRRYSQ